MFLPLCRPFRQGVVRVIQSIFVCDISTIPIITLDRTVSCHGEVEWSGGAIINLTTTVAPQSLGRAQ